MAAVYPYQYKSFTPHRNLLDDVDASHVNGLQDEVAAIQQTLGIAPHQDTKLKMHTNTWASVADRLDSVQRGKGMPVIYLTKSSDSYKGVTGQLKTLSWPAPSSANDPEGLFNGHSITANRTGWWIIMGRCVWLNATGSLATGDREITINVGGSDVCTQDSAVPSADGNTHMNIAWQGWVSAGKTIDMRIFHPLTGKTLSVGFLQFSAAMLREQ